MRFTAIGLAAVLMVSGSLAFAQGNGPADGADADLAAQSSEARTSGVKGGGIAGVNMRRSLSSTDTTATGGRTGSNSGMDDVLDRDGATTSTMGLYFGNTGR
jgi:hypothetical protein